MWRLLETQNVHVTPLKAGMFSKENLIPSLEFMKHQKHGFSMMHNREPVFLMVHYDLEKFTFENLPGKVRPWSTVGLP